MHSRFIPLFRSLLILAPLGCGAQTLYDFGNPTADEQLYIELINRARANPPAEGVRLAKAAGEGTAAEIDRSIQKAVQQYGVNLTMMKNEFNLIASAAPLAPNRALMDFARTHSQYMLDKGVQGHEQNGLSLSQRVAALQPSYNYSGFSENVYATAKSVAFGHAGFQIDWGDVNGVSVGGMQPDRGHRDNIHDVFDDAGSPTTPRREIGVGVKYGSHANGKAGPSAVTQDFSRQSPSPIYATGVVYYDLDGDSFYDAGEGVSGVTVNITNPLTALQGCITAAGGGWVIPVSGASTQNRTMTFSGLNVNHVSPSTEFLAATSKKYDLKLTYTAPAITSTNTANVGTAKAITFPATPGATGYKWHRWTTTAAVTEPADNTNNVNPTNSQMLGNSMLNTSVKDGGSGASFWLANYFENSGTRRIELSRLYRAGNSPAMTFRSRMLSASADDIHKVQVKEEGSVVWTDVYTQPGTGNGGSVESSFTTRTADIASFANKTFRVRFILDFDAGGNALGGTPTNTDGWFIDNIAFTNIQQLENDVVINLATNSGSYTPSATGTILQSIAPVISEREFPGAYQTLTISPAVPVTPTFASWATNLETANSLPAGTLAAANGDHDKDGRVNLLEYAFGTSPVTASEAAPRWPKIQSATATSVVIEYQVDLGLTDLTVTPEATLTLDTWYGPTDSKRPPGFVVTNLTTTNNIQTRQATLPLSAGQKGFLRVKATQNP